MSLTFISQRKVYNTGASNNIISDMFANGKWLCYVLEDILRADGVKVDGETCIPADEYSVVLTYSNRFKRMMPLIYNTADLKVVSHGKEFSGVRMHGGQTEADTHACLLTAYHVNEEQTRIQGTAVEEIIRMLAANGGKAKLIIQDMPFTGGGLNNKMAA
jgi:hypothetical protein